MRRLAEHWFGRWIRRRGTSNRHSDFPLVGGDSEKRLVREARDHGLRRRVRLGVRCIKNQNRMRWKIAIEANWPSRKLWWPFVI